MNEGKGGMLAVVEKMYFWPVCLSVTLHSIQTTLRTEEALVEVDRVKVEC